MSRSTIGKIVFIVLILISIVIIFVFTNVHDAMCAKQKTVNVYDSMLTKQETVRLAWYKSFEGTPTPTIARANPAAKEDLLTILKYNNSTANNYVIIAMLGYIGDASDAATLECMFDKIISSEPGKKLTHEQRDVLGTIAAAWGNMSYRGIPEAKAIAEKKIKMVDWASLGARWHEDELLQRMPEVKYDAFAEFINGYALSEDPNLKKYIDNFLKSVEGGNDMKKIWRFDYGQMKKHCQLARQQEKEPIPKDMMEYLHGTGPSPKKYPAFHMFSEDKRNFKDSGYLKAVIKDAVAAYEKITAEIIADNSVGPNRFAQFKDCILDNGCVIGNRKWDNYKSAKGLNLDVEKSILEEVKKAGLNRYSDFLVKIETKALYPTPQLKSSDDATANDFFGQESIIVTFSIPGTAKIYNKYIHQMSNYRIITLNQDMDMVVYMEKINGKWYWNPFGW